jgi:hypothetical protein
VARRRLAPFHRACSICSGQHVIRTARLLVTSAGGTRAGGPIACKPEPLTVPAPAPVILAIGNRWLLHEEVVAAARTFVRSAHRACTFAGVPVEPESLALTAPAPIRLRCPDGASKQPVVPTSFFIVTPSGRTRPDDRVAAEPQSLTLSTPAPLGLRRHRRGLSLRQRTGRLRWCEPL